MGLKKKGIIIYLVIFAIFLATAFFFLLFARGFAQEPIAFRGQIQLGVLQSYIEGEGTLFYVDLAAKYAGRETAVELADKGGFYGDFLCGNYKGHALWNNESSSCIPDYATGFERRAREIMDEYLKEFPAVTKPELGVIDFKIQGTYLIGKASENYAQNIYPIEGLTVSAIIGRHYVNPSFNVDVGYNISEYEKIREQAGILVAGCKGKADLDGCINSKIKEFKNPSWRLGVCEGVVTEERETLMRAFCVLSDAKLGFDETPVKYRIALYFG